MENLPEEPENAYKRALDEVTGGNSDKIADMDEVLQENIPEGYVDNHPGDSDEPLDVHRKENRDR